MASSSPFGSGNSIEAELAVLETAPKSILRSKWQEIFGEVPPKSFGPDLLRRALAHRLQEIAYGGLSKKTLRLLDQLIAQSRIGGGKITLPRQLKPGALLIREWRGKRHDVMTLESGFSYQGKAFDNLSQIARQITGTRWNGPRFFGLRALDEASS